ncbi:tyrosine-protein kinase receptor Tie-1-like isoform X2 [Biomphalaria glabrata]|uniref:Tyrosine-protein kinase receptor Tie-1-like isoform X2 n=1 Tax=Biomphalaria glabrata TaxID=6526 RepID=A0A9W3AFX9_BIOGL|nr:tyrosine-protein kinase receptor Tie-1-like isoform X2 [Biomphalaria glabrata]
MARNMIFWLLLIIVTETRVARSREPPCLTKDICPSNMYCSEQADYSVKCYPCHSECEPSQGCDGPMSEQCRACKTGYTKQPGFSPCRASTCPVGTYGNQCQNQCHCHNNDLCVQGRCTGGHCERGRTGLPFCLEACPAQTFGLDCRLICHCKDQEDCNKIQELPKLYFPPQVLLSKCNNITLRWFSFDETDDIGQGPIGLYKVMMKQMNGDIWLNPVNVTDPDIVTDIQTDRSLKKAHVVSITSGLVPDVEYTFRVDIVASEYDKLLKRTIPGEPSEAILYKCDKLPSLLTAPQAVFSSCNNLTVTWKEFDASKDEGGGPISHYLVFIKANITDFVSAWTPIYTVYSQNRVGLSYTVNITTGLIPNLAYNVRVDSVPQDTNNEPLNKYMDGRELRDPVLNQCDC